MLGSCIGDLVKLQRPSLVRCNCRAVTTKMDLVPSYIRSRDHSPHLSLNFIIFHCERRSFHYPLLTHLTPLDMIPIVSLFLISFATSVYATPVGSDLNIHPTGYKRDVTTRNDLVNNKPCAPVTVIFARGTIELGNVGIFAGPPFFTALGIAIGNANFLVQGVDYAASIVGYLKGGDSTGSAKVVSLTNLASSRCPDTQIVLSGYR